LKELSNDCIIKPSKMTEWSGVSFFRVGERRYFEEWPCEVFSKILTEKELQVKRWTAAPKGVIQAKPAFTKLAG
jgi:hypothetical protein